MTNQAIFYKQVTPVSKHRHAGAAVKTGTDYSYARAANAVPVTAVEFASAAPEYAIVFAGTDATTMPMAVLGALQNDNRYVDAAGHWTASYVPAFVRRYPFVFSSSDDGGTFTLCIDESFSGFNSEGRGERLFDADGERTQYLSSVLNFQQEYQAQFKATRALCDKLKALALFEPVEARFTTSTGRLHALTGFSVISRDKLRALTDEQLAGLARGGELELVYLHLHSLRHLREVGENLEQRQTTAAGEGDAPTTAAAEDVLAGSAPAGDTAADEMKSTRKTH